MRFDTLSTMADKLMLYKYVIKNVAWAAGQDGHVHAEAALPGQRLGHARATSRCGRAASRCSSTRRATPACPTWPAGTSAACSQHAPSILAFTNPTTNSYKRLVPGYEAPVNLVYSQRNRSAAVPHPAVLEEPEGEALEFRCPDPSCNPYLAFSAMLMAGLDGIQNRIEPPTPLDRDLYDLPPEELAKVPQVPGSLDEVLDALEADHEFLLAGGVFTPDVIETWVEYKRTTRSTPSGCARTRRSSTCTTTSRTSDLRYDGTAGSPDPAVSRSHLEERAEHPSELAGRDLHVLRVHEVDVERRAVAELHEQDASRARGGGPACSSSARRARCRSAVPTDCAGPRRAGWGDRSGSGTAAAAGPSPRSGR